MDEKRTKQSILLIMGVLWALPILASPKIAVVQPHRGTIQKTFTELAQTKLENTYEINMPSPGELDRITLKPGDAVKKGQWVAQMTQLPLVEALEKAKAQLNTMQAYLVYQQKDYIRKNILSKRHYVSKEEVDDSFARLGIMKAQVQDAQAAIGIANYNLQQSKMYSPVDGVILNRYNEGQQWEATGTPLLTIGNLNELEVVSDVLSQDAEMLHVGDSVVLISTQNNLSWPGKIKRIDPAGFTKKSSLGVDEQRVDITITFDNLSQVNLGVGYRLLAEFLVGKENPNALIVPRFSVLQDSQGNFYVFKVVKDKLQKQMVKIGVSTDREISILSGLTDQDIIVSQPNADMQTGMKVKI